MFDLSAQSNKRVFGEHAFRVNLGLTEPNLLTCRSKAYPIPDDAKLYRWVLRDGTVVTTTHEFPQSDCAHLYTFDGRYMYVPESNIAYVMEDVASVTGEVSGDVQDR